MFEEQKDSQCGCSVVNKPGVGGMRRLGAGGASHTGCCRPSEGDRYSSWCLGSLPRLLSRRATGLVYMKKRPLGLLWRGRIIGLQECFVE